MDEEFRRYSHRVQPAGGRVASYRESELDRQSRVARNDDTTRSIRLSLPIGTRKAELGELCSFEEERRS